MTVRVLTGDCRAMLATLPAASIHCCVTSPPYFGLRDYGTATWEGGDPECDHTGVARRCDKPGRTDKQSTQKGSSSDKVSRHCLHCGARRIDSQIGLEETPADYVAELVAVFREVRRVLRDDGTLWLVIGDSYNNFRVSMGPGQAVHGRDKLNGKPAPESRRRGTAGLKEKDLLMIPARVALALQADGWWLRSDIIWHKPNPMPESVTDRPTSAHEHVLLLAKSQTYFFDADAVREPHVRIWDESNGGSWAHASRIDDPVRGKAGTHRGDGYPLPNPLGRNIRNVWTIPTQPYPDAHFATFPPALVEPCIKAGCREGGTVLDPFGGAGTVGLVADRLKRNAVLVELNPAYAEMARERIAADAGMFGEVA